MRVGFTVTGVFLVASNVVLAVVLIRVASWKAPESPPLPAAAEVLPVVSLPTHGVRRTNNPGLRRLFAPLGESRLRDPPATPAPPAPLTLRLVGIMSVADEKTERIAVIEVGATRRILRIRAGEKVPGTDATLIGIFEREIQLRQDGTLQRFRLN